MCLNLDSLKSTGLEKPNRNTLLQKNRLIRLEAFIRSWQSKGIFYIIMFGNFYFDHIHFSMYLFFLKSIKDGILQWSVSIFLLQTLPFIFIDSWTRIYYMHLVFVFKEPYFSK